MMSLSGCALLKICAALRLVTLLQNVATANSQVYNIVASPSDPCPEDPESCITLSQFSNNVDSYLGSNTTLLFHPGTHLLDSKLSIAHVQRFLMSSLSNLTSPLSATIICEQVGNFNFYNTTEIKVHKLDFSGCGGNRVLKVMWFILEDSNFFGLDMYSVNSMFEVIESKAYIIRSKFMENKVWNILHVYLAFAEISQCNFTETEGRVIFAHKASLKVIDGVFYNNSINNIGGGIYADKSEVLISKSNFSHNYALNGSAAIHTAEQSHLRIDSCVFHKNVADNLGGAMALFTGTYLTMEGTVLIENFGRFGGAIATYESIAYIERSQFVKNEAETGGAIYAYKRSSITTSDTVFTNNTANSAIVVVLGSFVNFSNGTTYSNNIGSLLMFNSRAIFSGLTNLNNNHIYGVLKYNNNMSFTDSVLGSVDEGGALTAVQSEIHFDGTCIMTGNSAKNGGAIHAVQSKLQVYGKVTVYSNIAEDCGGGVYLSQSELRCKNHSKMKFIRNYARNNGGGIYVSSSLINTEFSVLLVGVNNNNNLYDYTGSTLNFTGNSAAANGGGIFLESQSKIYVLKEVAYSDPIHPIYVLTFTSNSANYGGALYIADKTNSGTCTSTSYKKHSTPSQCFLQTLALHGRRDSRLNLVNTDFDQNNAMISGSTLFGGLLDRCTTSSFAEVYYKYEQDSENDSVGGLSYLMATSNIQNNSKSISSNPVRLCFCIQNQVNCGYQPSLIQVKKGENFTLTIVTVDQLNNSIANASVHSYLAEGGSLHAGQLIQNTGEGCTNLTFTVSSQQQFEQLIMYAVGPCGYANMSLLEQDIEFLPCTCPVGFQQDFSEETKCECKCDSRLNPYITECNIENKTLVRSGDFWITYINESDGYIVYPHCPLDYCKSPNSVVYMNFNTRNGSDAQCSFHRSGMLCGSCETGLSLSLYSSNCVVCPSYWPALLVIIVFATVFAGIFLVALVLVLNLTVAIGTLNGVIFYANIVSINKMLLFPFQTPNFVTVFIAWLNLEIGFDTCFFEGMDAYWKTWLQMLFPIYIILLVILVTIFGEHSHRFAHLIGRKNPVATLATLILLSFDKLFHTAIGAISFAILDYPDGSHEVVWLLDANVKYFSGKHIPLFITALVILLGCVAYIAIVFLWQWLLRCPDKALLRWIRSQKLHLFLKTYHAPYTIKHRYWTGLLLVVRAFVSISSAVNTSNDPSVNLLLLGIAMIFLLFLVGRCSPVYENSTIEFLETTFYVNVTLLFAFSLFFLEAGKDQTVIAYISGTTAIVQFLLALGYHVLTVSMSKNRLCAKVKIFFEADNELKNYPPLNNNGRNPLLENPALISLDHHRENHRPLIHTGSKSVETERDNNNKYEPISCTESGVVCDEKSSLISRSSTSGYYS